MICCLPRRRRGFDSAPSGVPEYASGLEMDAAAEVGKEYALIGTTTRAIIARLVCAQLSPVKYRMIGPAYWYQADGDEFTGVFKWVNQGGATHTWGTAGSRATGGIINGGNGAQFLEGLVPIIGCARSIAGWVRLVSLALTAGNGAWIGFSRSGASTVFTGAGLGVNATPAYACAAFAAQSLTAPTLTTNTAFVAPSTAAEQRMTASHETNPGSLTESVRGGITQPGGVNQFLVNSPGVATGITVDDRIPCISGRVITWRLIEMEVMGQT